ncbi:MAG: serine/threonine-protein kinase, partial [Myxococcota bacterium]
MARDLQTKTHVGGFMAQAKSRRRQSGTLSRTAALCPVCATSMQGERFCRNDGYFATPFALGGRYEVQELIGKGGMGFVFGGEHSVLGKPVAIKVMHRAISRDDDHAQRFLREARLASQLRHENIVGMLDFGHDEETELLYLVMDRLRGQSLAELIAQGPMTPSRLVPILLQLARALAHAHEQAIVHRDVTPRNIILESSSGREDLVRLCDFGLSRSVGGQDRVTSTGEFLGTPAYMAPAQIRGDESQGPDVDVYALGCVAYEALTGVFPHAGSTPVAMIASRLAGPPTPPIAFRESIPADLNTLVMRCLAEHAGDRPSASDLERELGALSMQGERDVETVDLLGRTVGSYTITELIGTGGVGMVYRAEHPSIETTVAVKVLRPELAAIPEVVDRFIREARTSNGLRSPYIPRYHDFGTLPDGRAYAVMEFLEGESLATRIERGRLSLGETKRILAQVLEALAVAHEGGVVHRDIKPDNLFLTENAQGDLAVRVLDFGIASAPAAADRKLTQANTFVGTPAYCAPEQILGQRATPQTDLYALGVTAFEMLTGAEPSVGVDMEQLFAAKIEGVTLTPSAHVELPAIVDETLQRATATSVGDRYPTAREMAAAVARWSLEAEPVALPRPRVLSRTLGLLSIVAVAAFLIALLPGPAPFVKTPGAKVIRDAISADALIDGTRDDQTRDDQTRDDQTRDDQTRDDQTRDDQTRDDQTRDDQTRRAAPR